MTGSDILDNFADQSARIGTMTDEEIAGLIGDVIAEVVSRRGELDSYHQANLKSLFGVLPQKQSQSLWNKVLAEPESKKVAMTWQADQEFCDLLRGIFGMATRTTNETTLASANP